MFGKTKKRLDALEASLTALRQETLQLRKMQNVLLERWKKHEAEHEQAANAQPKTGEKEGVTARQIIDEWYHFEEERENRGSK